MPAKSLGAFAMDYAIGELQNPLPRKTMLCKRDLNNSRVSASDSTLFDRGRGLPLPLLTQKGKGLGKSSKGIGVPTTFGSDCKV